MKGSLSAEQRQVEGSEQNGVCVVNGSWVWCRHCQKCYKWGWDGESSSICPYWECEAESIAVVEWRRIRRLHIEFPREPESGVRYKVDGWLWCEVCTRCFRFDLEGEHCPYANCPPRDVKNIWPWWRIRDEHEAYAEIPERGKKYARKSEQAEIVTWRMVRVGDGVVRRNRDKPKGREIVCPLCLTINAVYLNRCQYCHELLVGSKAKGGNLRPGLRWNHPGDIPHAVRG